MCQLGGGREVGSRQSYLFDILVLFDREVIFDDELFIKDD